MAVMSATEVAFIQSQTVFGYDFKPIISVGADDIYTLISING